jgi:hypothetical protein
MMGRRGIASIRARRIRLPKIVQLLLDLWMREKMNSTPIIGPFLSQLLMSSAIKEARSSGIPSRSVLIFSAVGVPASLRSAIAPTIS